jgi:hypothetical protein
MTPGRDWRNTYKTWPTALSKLEYCERVMTSLRDRPLVDLGEERDEEVGDLSYSLQEYYSQLQKGEDAMPPGLEGALTAIFEDVDAPDGSAQGPRKSASPCSSAWSASSWTTSTAGPGISPSAPRSW